MRTMRLAIALIGCWLLALPALAQQAPLPKIGYLWGSSAGEQEKLMDAELAERGASDSRSRPRSSRARTR